jgi:hypothetical protein
MQHGVSPKSGRSRRAFVAWLDETVEVNVQPGPSFLRANRAVRPGRPQWQERCDTHRAWFSQKRESDVTI